MSNLTKMILDGNIHVQAGTVDHSLGRDRRKLKTGALVKECLKTTLSFFS